MSIHIDIKLTLEPSHEALIDRFLDRFVAAMRAKGAAAAEPPDEEERPRVLLTVREGGEDAEKVARDHENAVRHAVSPEPSAAEKAADEKWMLTRLAQLDTITREAVMAVEDPEERARILRHTNQATMRRDAQIAAGTRHTFRPEHLALPDRHTLPPKTVRVGEDTGQEGIPLKEWAENHGMAHSTAAAHANKGRLSGAFKRGNRWFITTDAPDEVAS